MNAPLTQKDLNAMKFESIAVHPPETLPAPPAAGVRRYESLFGRLLPVLDASELVTARRAKSAPDLRVFRLKDAFAEGSVFLGFGRPNVFLGLPRRGGGFEKFDAKSIKRADSEIVNTRGWAQSGMLFKLEATPEMIERLHAAAEAHVGERRWTCVNANARVLEDAGFTSGGAPLSGFYFPMALARQLIRHGLEFEGEPVAFDIVKTTPAYLENFGLSVVKAQFLTLCRHGSRYLEKRLRKSKWRPQRISETPREVPSALRERDARTEPLSVTSQREQQQRPATELVFSVSEPSFAGAVLTVLWGAHALFQVKPMTVDIDRFLPTRLKEFEAVKTTALSLLKQYLLFAPPVVHFLRSHLMRNNYVVENCPQREIFEMLRTDAPGMPNRYNIVITGESIGVVRVQVKYRFVDWILSKHVLTSGYSSDVRFAGEMWKGRDGVVYLNNESGTYQPAEDDTQRAVDYLSSIFTEVDFQAVKADRE